MRGPTKFFECSDSRSGGCAYLMVDLSKVVAVSSARHQRYNEAGTLELSYELSVLLDSGRECMSLPFNVYPELAHAWRAYREPKHD